MAPEDLEYLAEQC